MVTKITDITIQDVRFPAVAGKYPECAVIYVTVYTNHLRLKGTGFVGVSHHDHELCGVSIDALKQKVLNRKLSDITSDMGSFFKQVIVENSRDYLVATALINAIWDVWAHQERKPLWRMLVDMTPEEVVHCIDFTSIQDALTEEEALTILRKNALTKSQRIAYLLGGGYPASPIAVDWFDLTNPVIAKELIQANRIEHGRVNSCRTVNEVLAILLMAAKFNITVTPQVGGVGLCEYAQHLAMVDYIYISTSLDNRVLDYIEQWHEHFVNPVIVTDGHYQIPTQAGYSIEMKEETLLNYSFPTGRIWQRHEDTTARENGLSPD